MEEKRYPRAKRVYSRKLYGKGQESQENNFGIIGWTLRKNGVRQVILV